MTILIEIMFLDMNYNLDNDKYGPDADNLINKSYNINVYFDYYSVHDFHSNLLRKTKIGMHSKPFQFVIPILNL